MEFFMVQTGFYRIVTQKEAERRAEREGERQLYLEQKRLRRAAKKSALEPNVPGVMDAGELKLRLQCLRTLERQADLRSTTGRRQVQAEVRAEKLRIKGLIQQPP
jgi:hypothetical protein